MHDDMWEAPHGTDAAHGRMGCAPDVNELVNDVLLAVVEVMLPQDAGDAGVSHDICIAGLLLSRRERPVLLRASWQHHPRF